MFYVDGSQLNYLLPDVFIAQTLLYASCADSADSLTQAHGAIFCIISVI